MFNRLHWPEWSPAFAFPPGKSLGPVLPVPDHGDCVTGVIARAAFAIGCGSKDRLDNHDRFRPSTAVTSPSWIDIIPILVSRSSTLQASFIPSILFDAKLPATPDYGNTVVYHRSGTQIAIGAKLNSIFRPSISELAAFMAVANHRSFRKAADVVGSAPSTLSHTIRGLEEGMGVRLLNRTTRSVSPTEAGFRLISLLGPALDSLNDAVDSVAAFRLNAAGTVRINAPRLAAAILVRDVLPIMADRFPEVIVDIVVEGQLVDIVSDGFDAGVRLIGSIPRDMITVSLVKAMRFVCVASPDYLDKTGVPQTPDDLKQHRLIAHRLPSGKLYRWEFERSGQELVIDALGPVVLDDHDLMVAAAANGLGIAYVGSVASDSALAAGQVQEILGEWMPVAEGMALYYPGRRAVPPALRAFLDAVKEAIKTK